IKWSRNLKRSLRNGESPEFQASRIRLGFYRPFTKQHLYFAEIVVDELGQNPQFFPTPASEKENRVIIVATVACERPFYTSVTNFIPNLNFVGFGGAGQCFPFYVYDEDGNYRRENITHWALDQFRAHYSDKKI